MISMLMLIAVDEILNSVPLEPNLNHVAGFPVVGFQRGHGHEWFAGRKRTFANGATVQDKAGRVAGAFHERV